MILVKQNSHGNCFEMLFFSTANIYSTRYQAFYKPRKEFLYIIQNIDRLCGPVARVLGYRSRGLGSIPGTTKKKKLVGLERCPLSLVSTTEELLDRKVAAPV
jgi:hypothetical protein